MTEPFDTGDPSGRFLLTILAGVADLERETILERMWLGANRAAREGKWLGGIVPYGYRVNDEGYLEINENPLQGMDMSEADVIRLMYRLVAEKGYSTIKVADYINALGIPPSYTKDDRQIKRGKRITKTSGIWRPSRIRNLIVNTTYKGIHYYGKKSNKKRDLIVREVPAIISEEIWDKAQQVLKTNQLESMKNAKRQYLLRGKIKCGICGLTYHGTAYSGPGGKPKAYYVCGGKTSYRGPLQGKCTSKNVPQEWIENLVWNDCVEFINNPGTALKELTDNMEQRNSQKASLESEREVILKAVAEKEAEKQSILDLYRKKLIDSIDVEKQLQQIAKEKSALERQVEDLQDQISNESDISQRFNTAEELLSSFRGKLKGEPSFEVKRDIIKSFVDEVVINTKTGDNGRPQASITSKYTFSKVVNYTDKRASDRFNILEFNMEVDTISNLPENTLWEKLNKQLLIRKIEQKELAKLAGISEATIISIKKTNKARISTLRKIANALDISIDYFTEASKLPANTFGEKLRRARLMAGLSTNELAEKLGTHRSNILDWEHNRWSPNDEWLKKLTNILKL